MLRQWLAVVGFNLRAVRLRGASSLVVVGGIASVVIVLVALLAASEGFERVLTRGGDATRAIVLRDGVAGEGGSSIGALEAALLEDFANVQAASGEVVVVSAVERDPELAPANLSIRGVSDAAFVVRPEVGITAGRKFTPGLLEAIVGRSAERRLRIRHRIGFVCDVARRRVASRRSLRGGRLGLRVGNVDGFGHFAIEGWSRQFRQLGPAAA